MSGLLLTTKLYIPHPRTNQHLVPRPRLVTRLNEALANKLTLVSAPAGFGKTTLLSEWIPHSPRCVAWFSLDAGDNDPIRFWTYSIAALQMVQPHLGQDALTLLQSPQTPALEPILTTLLNDIATFPDEFVLVLDDYHVIKNPALHDNLTFWFDHLPPNIHLILTSRADPSLPLARLRAHRQLSEVRAADLRFTPAEAATFLNEVMSLNLSTEDITALETRTEGWIAGLQLAALSMQGRSDVATFIKAFTGSHIYIVDYLAEEVLHRQSESIQTFLLQTSILERLSGPLCDAVTGRSDGQAMLEHLHQHNLFIIPLDDKRQWYRYHHLFAEVLRARLRQVHADGIGEFHRRASDWYEQHSWMAEAVEHALVGAIFEQAVRLIEAVGLRAFSQGAIQYTLKKWLAALPVESVRRRSKLCLIQAWLLLTTRMDPAAAFQYLEEADQALRQQSQIEDIADARNTQGEIAATRALVSTYTRQFDPDQVKRWTQEALDCLRPDNFSYRGLVFGALGMTTLQQGDLAGAEQAFAKGAAISRTAGHEYIALATSIHLTALQGARGQLSLEITTCQQILAWAAEHGAETTFAAGCILINLADVLRERNDLSAALSYANSGVACSHQGAHFYIFMIGSLVQVRIKQALGNLADAFEIVRQTRQFADKNQTHWVLPLLSAIEAQLHLAQGNLPAALQWASSTDWAETSSSQFYGIHPFLYAYEYGGLTRAQVLIAQAQTHSAEQSAKDILPDVLDYLQQRIQVAEAMGLMWLRIKVPILQSLICQILGDSSQAMEKLEQALSLAESEGYTRIFLDEGPPMAELLRQATTRGLAPNYVSKLLAAFPAEAQGSKGAGEQTVKPSSLLPHSPAPLLVESLTARELEVLHLMAAGHSNQEIAQTLIVSVGTVKKHLNNIFGKLNVASRTQAIARARELHLL